MSVRARFVSHRSRALGIATAGLVVSGTLVAVAAPAYATSTTVSKWADLAAAFDASGTNKVTLGSDITAPTGGSLTVAPSANVTLDLAGHSLNITSPAAGAAAIQTTSGNLTIEDPTGTGSLTVVGGANGGQSGGAGIGGSTQQPGGNLTIEGGTINASTSFMFSAGIGGSGNSSGGAITIAGGSVTSTGGPQAAGIGGGNYGPSGTIAISGGSVTATGGGGGSGIGDGYGGSGGSITIGGGASVTAVGGQPGAGIGAPTITINGGSVTANGGAGGPGGGAGIGGTPGADGDSVTVTGGSVVAAGADGGAGIGGGGGKPGGLVPPANNFVPGTTPGAGGSLTIGAGASVTATSGGQGASAVGGGGANGIGAVGTVSNAGSLTLNGGEIVDSSASASNGNVTNQPGGVINLDSALSGGGTVVNDGSIVVGTGGSVSPSDGTTITKNNFRVTYAVPSPNTPPATQTVYSDSFADGAVTMPSPPAGDNWYSGDTQVTSSTDLTALLGTSSTGATPVTLYAEVPTSMGLSMPSASVWGEPVTLKATVSPADGSTLSGGTVTFTDGTSTLGTAAVVNGQASLTMSSLAMGSHAITASYGGSSGYTAATLTTPLILVVSQAKTSVSAPAVSLTDVSATVSPVALGVGTPTGSVTFYANGKSIGWAPVNGSGLATLAYASHGAVTIAADYSGDTDFLPSSSSTAVTNPTIKAKVSSSSARTRLGWYHSAVTVTFQCTAGTGTLTAPCPSPVTLPRSGAALSVSRTVHASDGGIATVNVSPINIDLRALRITMHGVRSGKAYDGAIPKATCTARGLSGLTLRGCRVRVSRSGSRVTYRATAISRAGLTSRLVRHVTVETVFIAGVTMRNGAYPITEGRRYDLRAYAPGHTAPRFIYAAPVGARLGHQNSPMHPIGNGLWQMQIALGRTPYRTWVMGIQIGRTVYRITVTLR